MDPSVVVFRDWLVAYRIQHPDGPDPDPEEMYDLYANLAPTNNDDRPVVADGEDLNQALNTIHTDVVRRRTFQTQTSKVDNDFWELFEAVALNVEAQSQEAGALMYYAYLNMYFSNDYIYLAPQGDRPVADARFVLDVLPQRMVDAVGNIAGVMDAQNAVSVMKFLGPGQNDKLDTVVMYCASDEPEFAGLRQALIALLQPEVLYDRLPLMVLRVAAGLGYGKEPPSFSYGEVTDREEESISFGEFRIVVLLLAYQATVQTGAEGDGFAELLTENIDAMFEAFGLDSDHPERQVEVTADVGLQQQFITTFSEWRNGNPNFYGNAAYF
ncbi:hypothetical protein [Nisaea sediminum]|uniref:hypothetical protein n=1 Tax=Nisaea sediminum TaxID=2775867 RepID=UPI001868B6C1|nr:hypothetical protein [Nisaea sediminum]